MNILHLNSSLSGGAASGAYRLHEALKQLGHNSKIVVLESDYSDKDVIVVGISEKEKQDRTRERAFLKQFKKNTDEGYYFFNPMPFFYNFNDRIMDNIPFKPDLLIVHWTTWFADVETFSLIGNKYNIPIIWYISDMEPMTGGCHYNFECNNYFFGCKDCSGFLKYSHSVARRYFNKKEKFIANMDLRIVASSTYMLNNAAKSALFADLPKRLILRGIDNKVFHPVSDKKKLRDKLGLRDEDIVIFFGAQSLADRRKGMRFLLEGLDILRDRLKNNRDILSKVKVVYAGARDLDDMEFPFESVYAGFMRTQQELATMYQLSDMYVCPTIQDSGPMMASESLMCGTPVVGFKMGVLSDIIHDGRTGFLADVGDSKGLADGIQKIIYFSVEERKKMSACCLEYASNNLTYRRQAEAVVSFGQ